MNNDERASKIKTALIITIVLLVVGFVNFYYNMCITKTEHISSIIFGFVPAFISIIKFIKLYNDTTGIYIFFNLSLIVLSVFFICCGMISTKVLNKFSDCSNYKDYEKVLNYERKSDNRSFEHFPNSIPNAANCEEFKQWGNATSDDSGMILSYNLSSELKDSFVNNVILKAKYQTVTKAGVAEVADKLYVPDLVYERLGLKDGSKQSENFEYYVLDASLKDATAQNEYSNGIIIDNENNNITYYTIKTK